MVCFVQGKVKKCFIALPSPLIMKKIYPIENIIIVNQNFAEAENNVGIDVAVVRECRVIKSSEIEIRLKLN